VKAFLEQVLDGQDLNADQVRALFNAMLAGELDPNFIAGMLIALRAKGESVVEIASAAKVMRAHAVAIPSPPGQILVDTCGTGGDLSGTFNLSTAAAITVATMGAKVAKHGNRSVSSKAGSADVLEALGVKLGGTPERLAEILQEVGISFLFAPAHHASTRYAVAPRKALGVRTIFNLLGPLTNPAGAQRQVLGVFAAEWVEPIAQVLKELGSEHALVVHGHGGLDELSISGPTQVAELRNGKVTLHQVTPEQVGLDRGDLGTLAGGTAQDNAEILRSIFKGERSPRADAVAYGAGAAAYVAGLHPSLEEGVQSARAMLHSGKVQGTLTHLVHESQR
jgi:anthranilate phosphoribosyltransferase